MEIIVIIVIIGNCICCFCAYMAGKYTEKVNMREHLIRNIEAHRYSPELQKGMKVLLEDVFDKF